MSSLSPRGGLGKVKVTSLYMPRRASQRKLGKSLQPNLCKQRGGDYDKKEKETEKRSRLEKKRRVRNGLRTSRKRI